MHGNAIGLVMLICTHDSGRVQWVMYLSSVPLPKQFHLCLLFCFLFVWWEKKTMFRWQRSFVCMFSLLRSSSVSAVLVLNPSHNATVPLSSRRQAIPLHQTVAQHLHRPVFVNKRWWWKIQLRSRTVNVVFDFSDSESATPPSSPKKIASNEECSSGSWFNSVDKSDGNYSYRNSRGKQLTRLYLKPHSALLFHQWPSENLNENVNTALMRMVVPAKVMT